ncbi:nucleoside recognition domain-containing protein [Prosthecobacter sp.]|uniref:nucleoside recognition domain-containing protein n=1 Tax=Prosthecobacter sp. TaxID=1965333 RepID=UPI0037832F24
MLNYIWATLLFIGLLVAGLVGRISGDASVIDAAMKGAEKAVMGIALPLAGMMMFWLGVLRLLEKAGVLEAVVRLLSPLLRRLFPDVPTGHTAMSAMVMNLSANMLGLSNNATPLGLKAMGHLQELNPHKQSASNAMITFLALNTGAFTLIPMTAMNFLNAAGVSHSFRVIVPTILATACASAAAVIAAKTFQRLPGFAAQPDELAAEEAQAASVRTAGISPLARFWLMLLGLLFISVSALELGPPHWRKTILDQTGLSTVLAQSAQRKAEAEKTLALKKEEAKAAASTQEKAEPPVWRRVMDGASGLAIPAILILAVGVAWARGVKVYEEFVDGAKEGFQVAVRIMPYLVAMLAVLAILRESGAFQLLEYALAPVLNALGFPVELLSLALMRPLSGSGAQGILNEILTRPDLSEMVKFTAGILYGSTETTFYVLTVYFGSVGIRRFRHALVAGLTADFVGMVAAVFFGRLLFAFV